MVSDELPATEVAQSCVVCPTEDVVHALMETLIDPLLPLRVSNVPPSVNIQKSVAEQMHAVVLLYNYHHRKQNPELCFLDFVSFCKLAIVMRPPLISFMKLMLESESTKSNSNENELSLTEKAIKEACDIAACLDASQDFPNTDEWPISKVAIVLIDSTTENCLLIETSINQEISSSVEKVGTKRKQNVSNYDSEFLQIGYHSVKEVTGMDSSYLEVLETHVTYSLSKIKSAVCFYMVQCLGSFTINEQVPLKFLVERLQGPVAEKAHYGVWKTTPVAEFHHMLPYVSFVSCWLSRGSKNLANEKTETIDGVHDHDVIGKFNNTHDTSNFPNNEESIIEPEILDKGNDKRDKDNSISGPSREVKTMKANDLTKVCTKRDKEDRLEDGANLRVNMGESSNLYHTHSKHEKVSGDKGDDVTISCGQIGISEIDQFEDKAKHNVQKQSLSSDSEDLQNALALLYRKRQEQQSRICIMEDTLALYEDSIARIRDGGDVVLARECITSIISGNYNPLLEHGSQKQDSELEHKCSRNNWRMPKYLIESSNGKFDSYVVVEGKDFKLHLKGGFEAKPCEARGSAAVQMIAKIQNSYV